MAEEDQAVHLSAQEHLAIALLPPRIVVRITQHHGIPLTMSRLFNTLDDQREKRVGDVRNGH